MSVCCPRGPSWLHSPGCREHEASLERHWHFWAFSTVADGSTLGTVIVKTLCLGLGSSCHHYCCYEDKHLYLVFNRPFSCLIVTIWPRSLHTRGHELDLFSVPSLVEPFSLSVCAEPVRGGPIHTRAAPAPAPGSSCSVSVHDLPGLVLSFGRAPPCVPMKQPQQCPGF